MRVRSHGIPNIVFRSEYVDSLVLFDRSRNSFYGTVVSDTFSPREESHVGEARQQLADFTLKTIVKVLSR